MKAHHICTPSTPLSFQKVATNNCFDMCIYSGGKMRKFHICKTLYNVYKRDRNIQSLLSLLFFATNAFQRPFCPGTKSQHMDISLCSPSSPIAHQRYFSLFASLVHRMLCCPSLDLHVYQ